MENLYGPIRAVIQMSYHNPNLKADEDITFIFYFMVFGADACDLKSLTDILTI